MLLISSLPEFMNSKNFLGFGPFLVAIVKFGYFFWATHSASEFILGLYISQDLGRFRNMFLI